MLSFRMTGNYTLQNQLDIGSSEKHHGKEILFTPLVIQ